MSLPEEKVRKDSDEMVSWVVVTQVKSNRVVYFTDDLSYEPQTEGDWYYCSMYRGTLPIELNLRNCWRWRFNGDSFEDAGANDKRNVSEKIIDANRKALHKILKDKINEVREPYMPRVYGGETIRSQKLEQARVYLREDRKDGDFGLLESFAVARKISMLEAAKIVVKKDEEMKVVFSESERFRESLSSMIESAGSEISLREIRRILLEQVYPQLSLSFKYVTSNTQPINWDAPVSDVHRDHEITRLKSVLLSVINKMREPLKSNYIANEEIRRAKIQVAAEFRRNSEMAKLHPAYVLLEQYAAAKNLNIDDAVRLLLRSEAVAQDVLRSTEGIKDRYLGRIEAIRTLKEIQILEAEIESEKLGINKRN